MTADRELHHRGRGNTMPADTFRAIINAIRGGHTLERAAQHYGYTGRTVQRYAQRVDDAREALQAAYAHRRARYGL